MIIRCHKCRGAKVFSELGNIFKRCVTCEGIGFIDATEEPKCQKEESVGQKVVSRRGRRKNNPESQAEGILS